MIVQMFIVGKISTNCYIANSEQTKQAIVIDPGFDDGFKAEQIFDYIDENMLTVKYIINTHGHPDHTCGNGIVKEKLNVPILIHELDAHMLGKFGIEIAGMFGFKNSSPPADILLHDEDLVKFGNTTLKAIHAPGHSPGSISLLGEKEVFTGDTLFSGSIGRTDFPESSEHAMSLSL